MKESHSNHAHAFSSSEASSLAEQSENNSEYLAFLRAKKAQSNNNTHENAASEFVVSDECMLRIKEMIKNISGSSVSVMISGESGTGKEVIARYIHSLSERRNQPFVAINCAALPPSLLESELFGFEKGAFTGAHQRHIGKFEAASGGTLLLDEITEIEPNLQAKLLRALQEQEIERIGGRETIKINTRIIATSNRNIKDAVKSGAFREDLYYRLQVVPIEVPPLRERPKDIKMLALEFIRQFSRQYQKGDLSLSNEALYQLVAYTWPGNVRELQNIIHRMVIMSSQPILDSLDLPEIFHQKTEERWVSMLPIGETLEKMETTFILETLKQHAGNRTHTARTLGISIRTLRNKINEYSALGIKVMGPEGE